MSWLLLMLPPEVLISLMSIWLSKLSLPLTLRLTSTDLVVLLVLASLALALRSSLRRLKARFK